TGYPDVLGAIALKTWGSSAGTRANGRYRPISTCPASDVRGSRVLARGRSHKLAHMKVLVTGASGFVGRATCEELGRRGHDVVALVRRAGSEPPGTRAQVGDLTDAASLQEAVPSQRPDAVIHLAAEIASQRDARKVWDVNVEGTRRLLE